MKIKLLAITSMFFSSLAFSYTSASKPLTVQNLRIFNDNYILFKAPGIDTSVENCSDKYGWIYLKQQTEAQTRQYSLLMSAVIAQRKVTIFLNGCSHGGNAGYPAVEQIMLN